MEIDLSIEEGVEKDFLHSLKIKDRKVYIDDFEIKGLHRMFISQNADEPYPRITLNLYVASGPELVEII